MIRVLYVVSNLRRSGPTNQLLSVTQHLDASQYKCTVLTLSPEGCDSRIADFKIHGVDVESLNLSRVKGLLFSKKQLKKTIDRIKPDIVHSQGIRADSLLSGLSRRFSWVLTSHNYPPIDYPMKYGRIIGGLMSIKHLSVMRMCTNVVSCSKTISSQIKAHQISSLPIQNGTGRLSVFGKKLPIAKDLKGTVFITVGSLINRKNVQEVVHAFTECESMSANTLLVLGDGPLMQELSAENRQGVIFAGNVSDVGDYLNVSDYYISASLAEGLPMTVIEALGMGLPCILSDIPSHREVYESCETAIELFKLGSDELRTKLDSVNEIFGKDAAIEARKAAGTTFSSERMSNDYQELYKRLASI